MLGLVMFLFYSSSQNNYNFWSNLKQNLPAQTTDLINKWCVQT